VSTVLKWIFGVLLLAALAVAGLLFAFPDHPQVARYVPEVIRDLLPRATRATAPASASAPRAAPPVETATVEIGRVADELEALGTLAANESVVIAPEIAGRVTRLGFKEGERVKEGQVLVALDAAILENEVKQAQANLDLAKDTYERARSLAQRGTGTQVALEQATAQLAAAEASVALARARLEKATIVAPFEGVVGLRSVGVGDYVAVGQNLITLTDIDPIKVDFRVPEIFLGQVKDGQKVEIRVDAIPGRTFDGQIYAIDPVVDVAGRAIRLRAQVPNPELVLKPGLFARVKIVTDAREEALLVPEAAVMPEGTGKAVYVVEGGNARLTKVEIGKRLAGKVEITEGLTAGAQVVVAGQMRLRAQAMSLFELFACGHRLVHAPHRPRIPRPAAGPLDGSEPPCCACGSRLVHAPHRPRIPQHRRARRLRPHELSGGERGDHRDAGDANPRELDRRHRGHRDHDLPEPAGAQQYLGALSS
jgi:membrane fusion protein (multidrug efflux system)